MERTTLSAEIGGIDLRGAVKTTRVGSQGVELSETVRRMEESIPHVIVLLEAAVERCVNFTGGSEADELILALDDTMLQYISTLQDILKSLRAVCGLDVISDGIEKKEGVSVARKVESSSEEEWSYVQGALQILAVSDCLTSRSAVFEASLRATLARLSTNLSISVYGSSLDHKQSHVADIDGSGELSMAGRAALDVAALRLVDVPDKSRKLFNLLEQVPEESICVYYIQDLLVARFLTEYIYLLKRLSHVYWKHKLCKSNYLFKCRIDSTRSSVVLIDVKYQNKEL